MKKFLGITAVLFLSISAPSHAKLTSGDVTSMVNSVAYKDDQVKRDVTTTADKFNSAVQENDDARKNLDAVSKDHPEDKTAYKAALRRSLDADDALEPFDKGFVKAAQLRNSGYAVSAPADIIICNAGACAPTDPVVLLFLIIGQLLTDESNKDVPFGPNNDLVKFLDRPLGGSGSELVKARDWAMDRLGINGENNDLGRAIKDPGKELKRGDIGKTICNWFGC